MAVVMTLNPFCFDKLAGAPRRFVPSRPCQHLGEITEDAFERSFFRGRDFRREGYPAMLCEPFGDFYNALNRYYSIPSDIFRPRDHQRTNHKSDKEEHKDNNTQEQQKIAGDCEKKEQKESSKENKEEKNQSGFDYFLGSFLEELYHPIMETLDADRRIESTTVPFEQEKEKDPLRFDMRGCDPDTISIKTEDNLLKVEGKRESDTGVMYVRYERSLPEGVPSELLSGSLSPRGLLTIKQGEHLALPVDRVATPSPQNEVSNQEETK